MARMRVSAATFAGILGADVSVWATVAVAGITGIAAISGSVVTGVLQARASASNSTTALQLAARERFSNWQLHKRDVYAEFLHAARDYSSADDSSSRDAFADQRDRALLVANRELRVILETLPDAPDTWTSQTWSHLIEAFSSDARQVIDAT
jgi:hypothetical protein